jgi:hypothetical protein
MSSALAEVGDSPPVGRYSIALISFSSFKSLQSIQHLSKFGRLPVKYIADRTAVSLQRQSLKRRRT